MNDEGLRISDASYMQDEFETGHECSCCFETSLHTEGEHAAETMLEVFASKLMVRIALETGIVYAFNCRMLLEELCHSKGIVAATFSAKRKSLKTLKHQE